MEHKGLGPRRASAPVAAIVIAAAGVIFMSALAVPARAISESGGQPGAFMFYGVGGRALAMGGAYYGISDDASASYWNPAGLAQLQRKEINMMQATLFQQTKLTYFSLAYPTKKGSTFALSVTQLASSGFEQVDVTYNPATGEPDTIQSGGDFSDQQQAIGLSWAKNVTETVAFGMTAKQVTRKLGGSADNFKTLDLGTMKAMGPYRAGLGIQNVFHQKTGDTDDKLPVILRIGNSLRLFKDRLTLALDGNKPLTGSVDLRFGGEYWIARWFAFRFGLMGLPGIQETDFGFGLNFRSFSLDLAQGIHDLGSSTRMSVSMRFGQSKGDRSTAQVRGFMKQGMDAFQEGNFALAAQRFNQALDAQPDNKQVQAMLARLLAVTGFVPQAMGGEEFQTFVRRGAISYVDGRDMRSAVNALRYAFNKNSKDEKLLGLLNMVEKEAGVAELTRRMEGPEQFTWVDQKVYDARQSVYDGKYDAAVRRAQDVLDLEPNNVTALEIMGSAFFLMEQKEKALAVWKRALEIDPNNRAIREFMQGLKR
ncbi:MAG: PorV/PorQ family protein [Elusimicrobia bacterium]|nr:PorV/PorQ family protein [Elusimicrobiota bacterium]